MPKVRLIDIKSWNVNFHRNFPSLAHVFLPSCDRIVLHAVTWPSYLCSNISWTWPVFVCFYYIFGAWVARAALPRPKSVECRLRQPRPPATGTGHRHRRRVRVCVVQRPSSYCGFRVESFLAAREQFNAEINDVDSPIHILSATLHISLQFQSLYIHKIPAVSHTWINVNIQTRPLSIPN